MNPEELKSLVRLFFEDVWNKGNLEALPVFLESDFVYHNPTFPESGNGLEGYRQIVTTLHEAFPGQVWKVEDIISEGDKVVIRWKMQGKHSGTYLGIPPTGKLITFSGISIQRFVGSKIAEQWVQSDALGFLLQEGYIRVAPQPSPSQPVAHN